ncbi:TIGR00730 family Rossman fold protein [Bosea caraganae]|uniref:Cytokinin riboside 5'-monophosphate phosphoribohydrolase n=1 Tax=Bosea caraganae TaxID=2763117 RepID=A0A370L4W2_9HYPH|nr:TIGR00730 family Rossman fold protein [Bosea caraganae]RDJ23005.1 TIGR00730 family Rossman fold protein [Bosea caraganae]RDJ28785.1 TIGR00730 family Rossman fold protein [Bosea caraganae]
MKSVCVFCGSNPGNDPVYAAGATAMGVEIAKRGLTLVYGGGAVGLMGIVANAALAAGGRVHGIIPRALREKEIGHNGLSELEVVDTMHTRKARMAELSDGFIAMPGGIGTFEELFEVWTWGQLGIHTKPLAFLNIAGFYDPLASFLDNTVEAGFLKQNHRAMAITDTEPATLLDRMEQYVPSAAFKWVEKEEV